jgi:putative restriction endonuclease
VLAELITEFGPPSTTIRVQSAAYPFTRLRADEVWVLDHDVPMDLVGPLDRGSSRASSSRRWSRRCGPSLR